MAKISIRIHLDPSGAVGPGKIDLLRQIDALGSIAQAAKALGMSYARAWSLIDEMNSLFGERVVSAASGGPRGGGAELTQFGRTVLNLFDRIVTDTNRRFADELAELQEAVRA